MPEATEGVFRSRYRMAVLGEEILVDSPLVGRHQLRNIALAIASAEELAREGFSGITARTIEEGIRDTRWPGRFEVIPGSTDSPETVYLMWP